MAILSLVVAFIVAPVGIVFGVLARKQIRQTGEDGDGLALAGIIVAATLTLLTVLLVVLYILMINALFGAFSSVLHATP